MAPIPWTACRGRNCWFWVWLLISIMPMLGIWRPFRGSARYWPHALSNTGIGPVLAARIIQYRETNGPFNQIEELSKVNGIGPKNLEEIRPHLTILANQPGNGQNTENHQGKK
ncbi:MAG: helix-hairpin-helix domain-containing protein [Deltaproteobacteria bacterium]|nr:helix-hairpin-helix domain-containing protein [Deltaproteobacteria bacterium]